jgi:hypothetical protein
MCQNAGFPKYNALMYHLFRFFAHEEDLQFPYRSMFGVANPTVVSQNAGWLDIP